MWSEAFYFTGQDQYTIIPLDGAGKWQLRFAQRPRIWRFPAGAQKISICTKGVSKESLRSHIIVARAFGSGDNYMRSKAFFTFTP